MTSQQLYEQYTAQMRKIADVKYALAVLQWDQETYMPSGGVAMRAQQMATLSEIAHQLFADKNLGILLQELSAAEGLTELQQRNISLTLEDYRKNEKYSSSFVRELSEAVSTSYHAWIDARKQNDFAVFETSLDHLIRLKKEETRVLGFEDHPYDALLNEFEKGASVAWLDELFLDLQSSLKPLLLKVMDSPVPEQAFLHQYFDKDAQWRLGLDLLKQMGFDFERGRQDLSEHPFTTNFNTGDVRVTTRIDEHNLASMTWSCLHEGGHALYEQGLPSGQYGLPLGEYCSIGIHESQSRLWENCIGRSLPFLDCNISLFQQYFPSLKQVSSRQLYAAVNGVKPSLIRTEADELTYHFHILIRYEIEKKLMEGSITAKDIPSLWNDLYKDLLGVAVPDDKNGCLQDIHWSHGSFGYFPTYTLGSLYAAQFYHYMQSGNPGLLKEVGRGDYTSVHQWLQLNVYQYGRRFTGKELCNKITGASLQLGYFMQYLTAKYQDIYHFD